MDYIKLIESEVADFFAGFGGPGETDIQSGEAQRQLTERLLSVQALRERAEPVAYMWDSDRKDVDVAGYYRPEHLLFAESNVKRYGGKVVALYAAPPAPVVPEEIAAALIAAIEKEQDRLFGQDYLMDSKDCIDVIREEMERLKVCRGAMLASKEAK